MVSTADRPGCGHRHPTQPGNTGEETWTSPVRKSLKLEGKLWSKPTTTHPLLQETGLEEELTWKERLFQWEMCGNNPTRRNLCQGMALMGSLWWHMGNSTGASRTASRWQTHSHCLPGTFISGSETHPKPDPGIPERAGTRHFWMVPSAPQHKAAEPAFPPWMSCASINPQRSWGGA